jgi:hypothetical protein
VGVCANAACAEERANTSAMESERILISSTRDALADVVLVHGGFDPRHEMRFARSRALA